MFVLKKMTEGFSCPRQSILHFKLYEATYSDDCQSD